jgi:hypothetical protein
MEKFAERFAIAVILLSLIAIATDYPSRWLQDSSTDKKQEVKSSSVSETGPKLLDQFEREGIWTVDRNNHRCLIEGDIWNMLPLEKKEQSLQVIYVEEKTWWKLYDRMTGKLLGEVSSWGWKVYP